MKKRKALNAAMAVLCGVCALISVLALFLILGYIVFKGIWAVNWDFITKLPKPVGETGGGIANAIAGSAKIVALAACMGAPVGVLGGIYLAEYGRGKTGAFIRYCSDILNGMPSIIIGIFVYTLLVLPMRRFSALSGSCALAVIMIPVVLRNTEEFLRLVPSPVREGGLALGLPRWKVTLRVVLPSAMRGIMTGVILSVSRIAGETAPLIFTAFGNRFWDNGFLQPMAALPLAIFTYAISPYEDWHRQAWASALILIALVLAGNIAARLIMRKI
ncbi:MAG: phosphate ABC transporter permease PstA [Elusimicrobiales bacterium]